MRSKCLLVSNILATVYSVVLLFVFGGAMISAGGLDYIASMEEYFRLVIQLFGAMGENSALLKILYIIFVLLCIHIVLFVLGCFSGWLSYFSKKSGGAKFAATLYLLGTICFPLYLCFGLPITIVGFVGGGNQKKLNEKSITE